MIGSRRIGLTPARRPPGRPGHRCASRPGALDRTGRRLVVLSLLLALVAGAAHPGTAAAAQGQVTWAVHITLAPTWFDPAETPGIATPVSGLHFRTVRALDGVSLELRAGEVHGLVGENGAGKSTMIKILSAVLAPDEGALRIKGVERRIVDQTSCVVKSSFIWTIRTS